MAVAMDTANIKRLSMYEKVITEKNINKSQEMIRKNCQTGKS